MDFNGKRYCPWTDDTLMGSAVVESGLKYGVYDNLNNRKCSDREQGGLITSYARAFDKAVEMNEK